MSEQLYYFESQFMSHMMHRERLPQLMVQQNMSGAQMLMVLNYNLKASLTVQAPVSHKVGRFSFLHNPTVGCEGSHCHSPSTSEHSVCNAGSAECPRYCGHHQKGVAK